MQIESIETTAEVLALLRECGLPASDIAGKAALRLFGLRDANGLQAMVGLESYPPAGLLRSLAVTPRARGRGNARALVAFAERTAAASGIETLFLLTTTAETFFARLGYAVAPRGEAPDEIRATDQFSGLCPSAAAFMRKRLRAAE